MGGFSVVVLLGVLGALSMAILGAMAVAALMFVAATVIVIVFACTTKDRRQQGKKLGWRLAVPIVLYVLSIPALILLTSVFILPIL